MITNIHQNWIVPDSMSDFQIINSLRLLYSDLLSKTGREIKEGIYHIKVLASRANGGGVRTKRRGTAQQLSTWLHNQEMRQYS